MESVDIDQWERKEHFNFFRNMDYPQYNICANLDVTHFYHFVKEKQLSFYYTMIYATTKTANEIINFRYRIRDNQVILYDRIHPSFTDTTSDGNDLFKYVTVDLVDDLTDFVRQTAEKSSCQKDYGFKGDTYRDDLVYITCIPWISFTHLSHTISFNKDDAVPRLSWGKYFNENGKIMLPFSVQVNHAVVDGVHVGRYFSKLQDYLNKL